MSYAFQVTHGLEVNIFRVDVGNDGSLYFTMRTARNSGSDDREQIDEYRFSLHPGKSENYSTVKLHRKNSSSDKVTGVALTSAFKKGGFARVTTELMPWSLSDSFLRESSAKEKVNIGSVEDMGLDQMAYSIIASSRETSFPNLGFDNTIVFTKSIGSFNITVLLSAAQMPPTSHGFSLSDRTVRPEDFPDDLKEAALSFMSGRSAEEIAHEHFFFVEVAVFKVIEGIFSNRDPGGALIFADPKFALPVLLARKQEAYYWIERQDGLAYIR